MTDHIQNFRRRTVLTGAAKTLSVAGLLAVFGSTIPRKAWAAGNPSQDAQLLNAAIALEDEGVAAYQIAAESKLLTPEILKIGITFQGPHKQHRDDLVSAVKRLGGQPATPKTLDAYATDLGAASLKDQAGVLRLALKLERGAANAYLGLIPSLDATEFHTLAARMAGDETFHAAILGNALGEAIPQKALMFG